MGLGMIFSSLENAVRTAILHGNTLADIRAPRWAVTYGVTDEEVRAEFERQLAEVGA